MTPAPAVEKLKRFIRNHAKRRYASPDEVERAEWAFYINYLREGMTVFDAGAYLGEVTMLFSKFVGSTGRVHSFEASRASFERLSAMCSTLFHKNVVLNHLAVLDRGGMVKLNIYDDENMSLNTVAHRPLQDYGIDLMPVGKEEVMATTIDRYCEDAGIARIDLLKIDVEGAEYQVLLGAARMLEQRKVDCCVFEFGQTTFDMGNNPEELERFLKHTGYRIRNVIPSDPVFPGRRGPSDARFSVHVARPG
jgi:FkbM family methyltransferase